MTSPAPGPSAERIETVRRAARRWKSQLIDTGGRNPLLYYKPYKASTLDLSPDLPEADARALKKVLRGRKAMVHSLLPGFRDSADFDKRVRNIFRKAKESLEERGLDTLYVGGGQATWASDRLKPAAPVILFPAELMPIGATQDNFEIVISGEPILNPVLVHHIQTEYGVTLDDDLLSLAATEPVDWLSVVGDVCAQLTQQCSRIRGFRVNARTFVLANLSYAAMPMVEDLERSVEHLAANDIVAALAGDESARQSIRDRISNATMDFPDTTPPADEFLVLDADASQNWAINAALQGEPLVIEGPPGTGKSQTIANLISSLVARKKRVLFVAEKRAAIDAVIKRLAAVKLDDLVLDLHGGVRSKRELAQLLGQSLANGGSTPAPDTGDLHGQLVGLRDMLNRHLQAMHEERQPWGITAYELQATLMGTEDTLRVPVRLGPDAVARLGYQECRKLREALREWNDLGGSRMSSDTTPWAQSTVRTPEEAQAAYLAAVEIAQQSLPEARKRLNDLLDVTALTLPQTIGDWEDRLGLIARVSETLSCFEPSVFDRDLNVLCESLEPAGENGVFRIWAHLTNRSYRRAKKSAREDLSGTNRISSPKLLSLILAAKEQWEEWQVVSRDAGTPRTALSMGDAVEAFETLQSNLSAIGAYVVMDDSRSTSTEALQETADQLVADQAWINKLPRIRELERQLEEAGMVELLTALASRRFDAEDVPTVFDYVVARNIYDQIAALDPRIAGFDGALQTRYANDFRDRDIRHRDTTASRVRRAAAELAVETRDKFPDENDLVRAQAGRKRGHLPLRRMLETAPNVLTALRPCWTMSPLLVAEVIPSGIKLFDVVIFDEASQVPPAHAIGALGRARQAIVAGDRRQLPPTAFFQRNDVDEEEEEADFELTSADYESIMDVLLAAPLRPYMLSWHYRSHDERLIAFSNAHLYGRSLTTFPGIAGQESLRHVLVPHRPRAGMSTKSNPDEVERVVDLILDHASNRPQESLGVIAMGIDHANNIEDALRRRLQNQDNDHIADFFTASSLEPFFAKNLERVQGDERDAIILSVGYGKQEDGRMQYRFGPLNQPGGERRLNVAVTRARTRMTVVSSFSSHDMDPARTTRQGVEMLRQYLKYVESGGENLDAGTLADVSMNGFEYDVFQRLSKAGIPLLPQFGVGGFRIDFAASHPDYPGRMVLAIEADGASYHSSHTARDRDRLRQQVLENLGWTFHRIWSTEWFRNPDAETERALAAWREAVNHAEDGDAFEEPRHPHLAHETAVLNARPRGRRPAVPRGIPIVGYSQQELVALARWIESDTLLRTEEELMNEMKIELGYQRIGKRIDLAFRSAIGEARAHKTR